MSTLLVVGGSGFIGREICRLAVRDGRDVRSISRGGRPPLDAPWADAVSWTSADLFRPNGWRDRLDGVDAVVHAVGIIRETPAAGITFERLNGDGTIIAALEAERAGVDTFVFLSSSVKPPGVRSAYLTAKRRAEAAIAGLDLDDVTLRPGPVYGTGQPHFSPPVNAALRLADSVPLIADRLGEARPLPVDTVARAAYRTAFDPAESLLDVADVRRLGDPVESSGGGTSK
ncbi:NAD-dependent epimerase/dehydratase [Halorubrum aidingense JCM 13560]|uniref:NAD-dependent epimerase/dehydratase n=1 Tax=Halorubrum aidingense JCM 13560 TaxID=1230454 RepID=M0PE35_9EURY|nr:NAD-dependent epimerase/dehydratase family protein [Halorubrum aidingense]EMA68306.1 NAD-dependent epimerase/dehydratase [Halorubrum aidingense JCM 13560]